MKTKKIGKYIAIGTAITLTLCVGALLVARSCEKCKNIEK